ncbi:E3 ubiquitin-protein ligase RNF216 [Colletotrichum sidae]|uniref:E3 ubiquitin-protein ligase RNF216 n=1 Tax=Colletotrichum sidae TaxID=1347389 RepID=A0A4R8SIN8_9PEZI|nr:E3 ubiquitin-protein ligase RNF216 [Colletotrichum sidae]
MVFTKFLGSSPDMLQHAHPKPSTSAVSASKAHDTISTDTAEAAPRNGYIYDESHLRPLPSDCPDLRELNNSLDALAGLFPDVQIQVFREMLINFEEESRLAVVADALLKNRVAWVKGRWLVSDDHRLESSPSAAFEEASISRIPRVETFRSSDYKKAVQALAWHEFKGLSRSTINAVLAESNYSYLDARKTLVSLCSKSWRFTISSLFLRRKPVATGEAENHPLVIWKSTGLGAIVPLLKATGNAELDRELYRDLIQPLREQGRQSQVDKDRGLAALLNNEEAEAAEAMHECTCCFTDYSFEELDQRLAENSLLASSLPLVRCPFCAYAEVDDIYLPANETPLQIRVDSLVSLMLMVVCTAIMLLLLPAVLLSFLSGLLLSTKQTLGDQLLAQWSNALGRYRRRRRGLMFTCQNPGCGRSSCLSCSKSWTDIHVCNESSLVALRTQVEQAMSMAIKRVCPRCHTSFVKNSGCNKLTCPCGYKMCYVCRKDIGGSNGEGEGYRHFCEHFRPDGDPRPCTECTKCNLWESEDTDLVLRLAKEEAESKWREAEKRDLSGPERAFLEAGFGKNGTTPVHSYFQNGRLPTVVELCDFVVETVFI